MSNTELAFLLIGTVITFYLFSSGLIWIVNLINERWSDNE